MKLLNLFFILLFLFSAVVQYNDPDPYIWMPVYLYGALLCFLAVRRKFNPLFYFVGIGIYAGFATIIFFSETGVWTWISKYHAESIVSSMQASKPWIEETREFFGLLILIGALSTNMIWLLRERKKSLSV